MPCWVMWRERLGSAVLVAWGAERRGGGLVMWQQRGLFSWGLVCECCRGDGALLGGDVAALVVLVQG